MQIPNIFGVKKSTLHYFLLVDRLRNKLHKSVTGLVYSLPCCQRVIVCKQMELCSILYHNQYVQVWRSTVPPYLATSGAHFCFSPPGHYGGWHRLHMKDQHLVGRMTAQLLDQVAIALTSAPPADQDSRRFRVRVIPHREKVTGPWSRLEDRLENRVTGITPRSAAGHPPLHHPNTGIMNAIYHLHHRSRMPVIIYSPSCMKHIGNICTCLHI